MPLTLPAVTRAFAEIGRDFHTRGWVLGTSGNFSAVLSRNPLQLAMWAHEFRREMRLPGAAGQPPVTVLIAGLAAVGRATGFRARYPQYAARPEASAAANPVRS